MRDTPSQPSLPHSAPPSPEQVPRKHQSPGEDQGAFLTSSFRLLATEPGRGGGQRQWGVN